jgi:hypothetical protein
MSWAPNNDEANRPLSVGLNAGGTDLDASFRNEVSPAGDG